LDVLLGNHKNESKVFDSRPLNSCSFLNPESFFQKSDNFMAYFYLYRGKLKQKTLARIAQDTSKKLDEKINQLAQSKANEVELWNKFREEDSSKKDTKSVLEEQKAKIEALEQEKYFLFQELVSSAEQRPRASSYTFAIDDEPLEKVNEALVEENKELKMHIEELNKRILDMEEEDFKKTAELKLNQRLLSSSKSMTITENDGNSSPYKVAPEDICRKLVEKQLENEELKERVKKYDFAYKYLEKQLSSARSFADMFSSSNTSNFDIANKLVNTLTEQIADKDQEIIDLKSQIATMHKDQRSMIDDR